MALGAQLELSATVDPDLRGLSGQLLHPPGLALDSALERLPGPQDDLVHRRTYPGAQDDGELVFASEDTVTTFQTRLPHRYGALGWERGRGLWGNGGWYPQPLPAEEGQPLDIHDWTVTLELPPGTVGVLNGQAGEGTLRWEGPAERLSIAVLAKGRLEELTPGLWLLADGPRRPRRDAALVALAALMPADARPTVVVEAPQYRRLVRTGPGVLYLSDAAWRTPEALWRFHNQAVLEGLLAASLDHPLRLLRGLYAAARVPTLESELQSASADQVLRFAAFLPLVDMLLYSGRVPFHAELFDEVHPGDPLRDDLSELYSGELDPGVLAVKVDDREGAGTAWAWVQEWLAQDSEVAEIRASLSPWLGPWPEQDLVMDVRQDGEQWGVALERLTAENAPAESVPISIDGQLQTWQTQPGPDSAWIPLQARPDAVRLDPDGHLQQTDRSGERWPGGWTVVGTAAPTAYDLSQGILYGSANLRFRRRYDTRNLYTGSASIGAQDRLRLQGGYARYFGPLTDRRTRAGYAYLWTGGAWLSPAYRARVDGRYTLESGLTLSWDTRVDWRFPLHGHRLRASIDGGVVPESGHRWVGTQLSAMQLWAPHPRIVLAGTLSGGVTTGQVQHRLLSLGGPMLSVPPGRVVGQSRAVAAAELRVLAAKNLSVPLLWLYWLDEVQLTGGLEAGVVHHASLVDAGQISALGGQYEAIGARGAVLLTMDGLGAIPWTCGMTVGVPLSASAGLEAGPQLGVVLGQNF
ncbi:MAG: hypothetical protein VX899_17305 [Myxococcota bacterium]|nr:hypothetical protein [Myxococcota bacterium]